MTREEKQLLLQDLCARLPYKVKVCLYKKETCILTGIDGDEVYLNIDSDSFYIENIKPYLRPMSSMTEEEEKEFEKIFELELKAIESPVGHTIESAACSAFEIDFYNKYHFDYRGLIEKGLALEAPEKMYE